VVVGQRRAQSNSHDTTTMHHAMDIQFWLEQAEIEEEEVA
jgi:hypothetical protein